jgi:iron complex transport system substrate-binding protein
MLLRIGVAVALLCWSFSVTALAAEMRTVTDGAGRQVQIPTHIERVFAAGPPAAITLFTLAPDKLLGWTSPLKDEAKAYLPPNVAALPVMGRLTGRANTANVESVLAAKPDIIVDLGDVDPTHVSLAERTQTQTGIPYLIYDGKLERTPELYEALGDALGETEKARELADYARQVLTELHDGVARLDAVHRPRVYYARGADGLETALKGSINAEVIEDVGAENVAESADRHTLASASPEQILAWNPDVVVTFDQRFYRAVWTSPVWQGVKAVRDKRVYLAPTVPFPWIDQPPAVNRLIGLRWLAALLHPDVFGQDQRAAACDFYARFYHVHLSDAQLDHLLVPPKP